MILARDLAPVGRRRIIDARIALRFERDFGQLDAVGERQEEAIDFGAADHHDMRRVGELQCFLARADWLGDFVLPCGIARDDDMAAAFEDRSEEHTSELQSLMRISYAVFCLKQHKRQSPNTLVSSK